MSKKNFCIGQVWNVWHEILMKTEDVNCLLVSTHFTLCAHHEAKDILSPLLFANFSQANQVDLTSIFDFLL